MLLQWYIICYIHFDFCTAWSVSHKKCCFVCRDMYVVCHTPVFTPGVSISVWCNLCNSICTLKFLRNAFKSGCCHVYMSCLYMFMTFKQIWKSISWVSALISVVCQNESDSVINFNRLITNIWQLNIFYPFFVCRALQTKKWVIFFFLYNLYLNKNLWYLSWSAS